MSRLNPIMAACLGSLLLIAFSASAEAQVSVVLSNGDLTIAGTSSGDSVSVEQVGSNVNVSVGFVVANTFRRSSVKRIVAYLGGGNDFFTVAGKIPCIVRGGSGNDFITSNNANDTIYGDNGDDIIYTYGGNDKAFGGKGNDIVDGGIGDDDIFGDAGRDILIGGVGADEVSGNSGQDFVFGAALELNYTFSLQTIWTDTQTPYADRINAALNSGLFANVTDDLEVDILDGGVEADVYFVDFTRTLDVAVLDGNAWGPEEATDRIFPELF